MKVDLTLFKFQGAGTPLINFRDIFQDLMNLLICRIFPSSIASSIWFYRYLTMFTSEAFLYSAIMLQNVFAFVIREIIESRNIGIKK